MRWYGDVLRSGVMKGLHYGIIIESNGVINDEIPL